MVTVAKFGGTSVANGRNLGQVIDIILSDPNRRVNVLSGPGKRDREDTKITDLLVQVGTIAYDGQVPTQLINDVWQRFTGITNYFHISNSFLEPLLNSLGEAIGNVSGNNDQY